MANALGIDQIADFAATYINNHDIAGQDSIVEYIKKQGKKMYQTAVEYPAVLVFMADNALISLADIDNYLLDISWLEWPNVVKRLLEYKKMPPKIQKESDTEKVSKKLDDPKKSWTTEKLPDGTLKLKSFKGNETIINIPDKVGKAKVTIIGEEACSPMKERLNSNQAEARAKIRELVVSKGITTIEKSAFYGCTHLRSVVLSEDVDTIGPGAFGFCPALKDINLPENIKSIGASAFNQTAIQNFVWPKSVDIPYMAFAYGKIAEMVISDDVAEIGANAFLQCCNLEKVVFPTSINKIGKGAFQACTQLKEIRIPSGMERIESHTFTECKSLETIYIPSSVVSIYDGEPVEQQGLVRSSWEVEQLPFAGCKKLTIHTPAGSYAEQYAKKHRIPVVNFEE